MKRLFKTTALCLAVVAPGISAQSDSSSMSITRNGETDSVVGPDKWFTGSARIDSLFGGEQSSNINAAFVTFEPGARSNWHTHPGGQYLVVTSGQGWVQEAGGEKKVINPGDVVWTPPGVKHWHGASDSVAMKHMAIQMVSDGEVVEWMEPVSDAEYR